MDNAVCATCGAAVASTAEVCGRCGQSLAPQGRDSSPGSSLPGRSVGRPGGGSWDPGDGAPSTPGVHRPRLAPGDVPEGSDVRPGFVARNGVVEGQARNLQSRSEQVGESYHRAVWSFRVEQFDESGNRVLLVPVEMRGRTFEGSISDGDWVRARGKMRRGTFHLREVENLTTGAIVRAKGIPKVAMVILTVMFLGVLAWIAWTVITGMTADPGPPPGFPTGPASGFPGYSP